MVGECFNVIRTCQTFPTWPYNFVFPSAVNESTVALYSHCHCVWSVLLFAIVVDVCWRHAVGLLSISLMTSDVDYLSMFFKKHLVTHVSSYLSFLSIFKNWVVLLRVFKKIFCILEGFLYILDTSPLPYLCCASLFSLSVAFNLFNNVFWRANVFVLMKSNLVIFFLDDTSCFLCLKYLSLTQHQKDFFHYVFFRSYVGLALIFSSIVSYFEIIFI